ncbi:hypothetical protein J8F10_06465 [Gemmata sp. G18]|uniref:SbsA Ig-like domain-containing protein n=1 Tax=Gemmata palustris TaxID=2822762 RepID=A0ABS5BML5_9BACT|nr:hypothetical protein [Gemmata palustris]MBP3954923.1 hypothetical protein [Gemmata palustris]
MATYVELPEGTASTAADGIRLYTRVFRVYGLAPDSRAEFGIATIPILRFSAFPSDSGALAVGVSSAPVNSELGIFDVTYSYTSHPWDSGTAADVETGGAGGSPLEPGQSDPSVQPNPLLRPPTIKFSSNSTEVPFVLDYDPSGAKKVANSCHVPFEGETRTQYTSIITISFNRNVTDISAKQQMYLGTCNDASFVLAPLFGAYPAYTLRVNAFSGTIQYEEGAWFTACEVEFEYNPATWTRKLLDVGYTFKAVGEFDVLGRQVYRKFLDQATGAPLDTVKFLNGGGLPLADGFPPYQLEFYPHPSQDFSTIFS